MSIMIENEEKNLILSLYLNKFQTPRKRNSPNKVLPFSLFSCREIHGKKNQEQSSPHNQSINHHQKELHKINLVYNQEKAQRKYLTEGFNSYFSKQIDKKTDKKNAKNRCLSAGNQLRNQFRKKSQNLSLKNKLTSSFSYSKSSRQNIPHQPLITKQSKKTFKSENSRARKEISNLSFVRKKIKTQKTAIREKPSFDLELNPWKVTDIDQF